MKGHHMTNTALRYCLCTQCAQHALFDLGIPALSPQQFVARAARYDLTDNQRKIVAKQQRLADEMALQAWNIWAGR